jgi:putative oxygen-independent coproporphyrinogen III oxidase
MMNKKELPGLYVHIPFCKTKCPYCDFYSIADDTAMGSFLAALKRESDLYKKVFRQFDSLYFGGGTPSLIDEKGLEEIFTALRGQFEFSPGSEVTVEMNPDDVTVEKLENYGRLGVTRISLGVQSLNNKELAFLKRRHTAGGARKALALIQEHGFDNVGIDLMNGLPGQTEKSWMSTIEEALSFQPAHISCYQLTIGNKTAFGKMVREGKLKMPSEEKQRKIFLSTSRFLQERGFVHYEVSNFARGERYRSRHNLKYWRHVPYLGLGPAAHSFQNNRRWWNVKSIEEYCASLNKNNKPVEGVETLSPEQLELEKLFLGFRNLDGVSIKDAFREPPCENALNRLVSAKCVNIRSGKIIPTVKGYLIADRLPLELSR